MAQLEIEILKLINNDNNNNYYYISISYETRTFIVASQWLSKNSYVYIERERERAREREKERVQITKKISNSTITRKMQAE